MLFQSSFFLSSSFYVLPCSFSWPLSCLCTKVHIFHSPQFWCISWSNNYCGWGNFACMVHRVHRSPKIAQELIIIILLHIAVWKRQLCFWTNIFSDLEITGGSPKSPSWLDLIFFPKIQGRWWGPMNAICCSVNVHRVTCSTWRWWGPLNTTWQYYWLLFKSCQWYSFPLLYRIHWQYVCVMI